MDLMDQLMVHMEVDLTDNGLDGTLDCGLDSGLDGGLSGELSGGLDGALDGVIDGALDGRLGGALDGAFESRLDGKHDVAHLQLVFYPCVQSKNFPLSTFGDIAWTRDRTDTQRDARTEEKLKPISPRFTMTNNLKLTNSKYVSETDLYSAG